MEPVILFIAMTAIISGTIVKVKKISLERERMRLGMGISEEQKPSFIKNALAAKQNTAPSTQQKEIEEVKKRLENLEVIITDGLEQAAGSGQVRKLQEEIRQLSEKLKQLEKD